ncbi:hypothetical protein B0H19DRAFT_1104399 [Mycena capillaripes]|nr:hypothetical protein B0H19DRAFT_1104399 [Mycena capillaripes]
MSLPTFSKDSTAEEVADTFADEIRGKNVIVTGTSLNGIGFETARVIAKYANLVIITGYNAERLKLSEDEIKKQQPSANIRRLTLDLSSLAAVRTAAAEVNAYSEPIHVLINNAAAPTGPFKLTVDKLESQMGTGHVGPFLFTKLITPKLLAARTSTYTPRVVWLSSTAHKFGKGVDFDNFKVPDPEKYNTMGAYSSAKSANAITAIELTKRSGGKIASYSVCPGLIYTNLLQREESTAVWQATGFLGADNKQSTEKFSTWKTIPQGASTTLVAAFDTRLKDQPGAYLSHGNVSTADLAPFVTDSANGEKLWTLTEEVIGEKWAF